MNRSTCWSCEWFIYLSFNLSSYSIYLCVELETFVPGDGWTAWGVFPWHFNGLRRLLIPCCSSLCQAIKYKTSCRSPRWHTQLGCAAPMWIYKLIQSNKPKSSHYIEGYCIHTDNMGHHPVCSKEPRNSMTMTCQYSAGRNESSLPRATC